MAITANIHEAKTTLSKLIERALAGEEVIIARAGKPVVELKALSPSVVDREAIRQKRLALFGSMEGKMNLQPGWEESAFDADMHRKWYGEEPEGLPHAAETAAPFTR